MSLIINHKMAAKNVARGFNSGYAELFTSVRKLAFGLKTQNSGPGTLGLAVRRLLRADIAVLNRDGSGAARPVSLLSAADGALAVIDEVLVRMKDNLLAHFKSAGNSPTDSCYSKAGMASAPNSGKAESASEASSDAASAESMAKAALSALSNAIISRDELSAARGVTQKDPEHRASALQIRADNLEAAEALLSDLDLSLGFTELSHAFPGRRSALIPGLATQGD